MRLAALSAVIMLSASSISHATTFEIADATALFTPSFRGDANTTWLGWDVFLTDGDASNAVINDVTPDIGPDTGSFVTTNNEPHRSGSLNYYSGFGTVAEDITFPIDNTESTGFTTVIVQAITLQSPFGAGGFGSEILFSDLAGVSPTVVSTTDTPLPNFDFNGAGLGQFFAKYEIPSGLIGNQTISISSAGPVSMVSFDQFVIDTRWSATGFAPDIATFNPVPEPSAMVLGAIGCCVVAFCRFRFRTS